MVKTKKLEVADKKYKSLDEWKIDLLPNTVEMEHLVFVNGQDSRKNKIRSQSILNSIEPINLHQFTN